MAEALRAKNRLKFGAIEKGGSYLAEISGRRGHPPPTIFAQFDGPMNAL